MHLVPHLPPPLHSLLPPQLSASELTSLIESGMAAGTSFVFKFEYFSAHSRPLHWLSRSLFNLTGIPVSIHLYASAAGAQVLNPHTDPYDVLVWQVRVLASRRFERR